MSQENVEIVRGLQVAPDVDVAELFRDDGMWAVPIEAIGQLFHPDFESVAPGVPGTEKVHTGTDGLRTAWLEWMAPWATYRAEIQEVIDAGERVLVLSHDFGRREGSTQEVKIDGSAVWTVRDGKIARAEFHSTRSDALKAVGLKG